MYPFRILTFNGGGIRGAFGVAFLARLEELTGAPVVDHFDLIAGTSTGAIIAASLALGLPASELERFYREDGGEIFHAREPYRARGFMRPLYPLASRVLRRRTGQGMDSFFRARYCPFRLRTSLTKVFGDRTIGDLTRARVIIPSVNLSLGQARIFRTPHLPSAEADRDLTIVDVLRAATAAPTYFPHKVMPDGHAYCDGGVWANAPAVVAMGEAMKIRQLCDRPSCDPAYDTSTIRLLSIGTGRTTYSLKPPGADAGLLYWSSRIADVMGVSQMQGAQLPMEFALGDRYHPVDFDLPNRSWSLDGVDHIPELMALGRQSAEAHLSRIQEQFLVGLAMAYVPYPETRAVQEVS
ncbi:CBASS cGAMP-activated phospholipase [Paludisphaera soli]|uniref:CBASS cGAMP-activated phospholipase n=1 Tax=Paludisphaera soli TaxID=2712865 RepID=UPI0013EB0174|nr:CBASS cGAMP-activated phospholipase [Paludisphaera soli]